jgi:hypothetical protein
MISLFATNDNHYQLSVVLILPENLQLKIPRMLGVVVKQN